MGVRVMSIVLGTNIQFAQGMRIFTSSGISFHPMGELRMCAHSNSLFKFTFLVLMTILNQFIVLVLVTINQSINQ